jgi:hypothetical protein
MIPLSKKTNKENKSNSFTKQIQWLKYHFKNYEPINLKNLLFFQNIKRLFKLF